MKSNVMEANWMFESFFAAAAAADVAVVSMVVSLAFILLIC